MATTVAKTNPSQPAAFQKQHASFDFTTAITTAIIGGFFGLLLQKTGVHRSDVIRGQMDFSIWTMMAVSIVPGIGISPGIHILMVNPGISCC